MSLGLFPRWLCSLPAHLEQLGWHCAPDSLLQGRIAPASPSPSKLGSSWLHPSHSVKLEQRSPLPAHHWVTCAALCVFDPQLRLFEGEALLKQNHLSPVFCAKGIALSLVRRSKHPPDLLFTLCHPNRLLKPRGMLQLGPPVCAPSFLAHPKRLMGDVLTCSSLVNISRSCSLVGKKSLESNARWSALPNAVVNQFPFFPTT